MRRATALLKGFATMQTNGGHTSTDPWGNEWVINPVQAEDFSHRAIHTMTETGKTRRRRLLRPRARHGDLFRLLHRWTHGPDGSAALSG